MVTSGGVVSFLSSQERINKKLKIKLKTDNFFILELNPNYSVKLKTPLGVGFILEIIGNFRVEWREG